MFCMCIDRGCVVERKIRERSKNVFLGRLFIESALLMVKQYNDLLCHSQFDGSPGCVSMIC